MTEQHLEQLAIQLAQGSRDYSESAHRLLLVIGAGSPELAAYLAELNRLPHTHVSADTLEQAQLPSTRSLWITTPMQMVPEINRWLVHQNIAVYQLRHMDLQPTPADHHGHDG